MIVVFLALLMGYPVGLTLGGVAILFALGATMFGAFDPDLFNAIPPRMFGIMTNPILLAIPLFVFMGLTLQKAGIAERLFKTLSDLTKSHKGDGSIPVTLVGGILAACTGIVGASIATLGLMALPNMINKGANHAKAAGAVAAAGTLGQIMPPSIVLIVLADQMSIAYQTMQNNEGKFNAEPVLVPDMFLAAIIPATMLILLYIGWQCLSASHHKRIVKKNVKTENNYLDILLPLLLIFLTLGILILGYVTPAEAAAIGAIMAVILAVRQFSITQFRIFIGTMACLLLGQTAQVQIVNYILIGCLGGSVAVALMTLWKHNVLKPILSESVRLISIIFLIIFGASVFALVFRGVGGDIWIRELLGNLPGGTISAIAIVMIAIFILGFFLEFLEITYLIVPITAPVLLAMPMPDGSPMNPLWLGVLIALNLQTSFLTPPMGISLFYLRAVAPSTDHH